MLSIRDFSLWRMLCTVGLRSMLWPAGVWAFAIGLSASYCLGRWASPATRLTLAGDYLILASVLVGVVFATMALVVSLLSDRYLLFLHTSKGGFLPFMAPFLVGVAVQVSAIAAALAYRAAAPHSSTCEPWLFLIATVIFVYALADVFSLAKSVVAHAVTRAEHLSALDMQKKKKKKKKPDDPA